MRTKTLTGVFAMVAVSSAIVVLQAVPAAAACHFFTAQASPGDPLEGGTVELTVERDAAVVPSSVRVRTVDGSAVAGQDYVALDQRVEFSSGTTQTVTVETMQDALDEPDESFTVELSDGEGCEVNPNFGYGPPTTITVRDDDEPATTTEAPTTTATSSPTTAASSTTTEQTTTSTTDESVDGSATTTPTTAPTTSTTEAVTMTDVEDEAAADSDDDGTPVGAVVAAVVVLIAVVTGGGALWLRRSRAT